MGSPPIPDRSPPPRLPTASTSTSRASSIPPAFRSRSPPRPHPGLQPAVAPASVPFSPPKRNTGGSIKGKEKAFDFEGGADEGVSKGNKGARDFPSLPVATYRHLLGTNNGGAANPLRVIAHIDIDAAYAAMEMSRLSIPEDQPMAVQQWNGLIAVNYPARRFGITRHESPSEALKKCPDLRLVHVQTYKNGESEPGYWDGAKPETHKVSLDMYRKESTKILGIFNEYCSVVEKASIDESFLDLTLPVRKLLLSLYPSLSTPPPDGNLDTPLPSPASLGVESPEWGKVGNLVPFEGQKKDKVKRLKADGTEQEGASSSPAKGGGGGGGRGEGEEGRSETPEDEEEEKEPELSWSDIALYLGAGIVDETRAAVKGRLGYTCSAGVSVNKMLSKLCSGWRKPNQQTILRHSAVPAFLRPMNFQKIRNLGGKLGNAVKETYEVETVGELLALSLPELKAKLGDDSGVWLWEIVRGLDFTEVETKMQVKSMLSSKNFRPYIATYGEVYHWLTILATELVLRLKDAREQQPGLWPKTITFTHRSPQFVIRSHQAPFPFTSTPTSSYILKAGEKLLRIALGGSTPLAGPMPPPGDKTKVGPYSNIQLSFSGLERLEEGQRGIEGFFKAGAAAGTGGGGKEAGGAGRKRSVTPAVPMKEKKVEEKEKEQEPKKRKLASFFGDAAPTSSTSAKTMPTSASTTSSSIFTKPSTSAAVAAGFPEELVLSSSPSPPASPSAPGPSTSAAATSTTFHCPECKKHLPLSTEGEHQDWHVAKGLMEEERRRSGWGFDGGGGGSGEKKKKSVRGEEGGGGPRKKKVKKEKKEKEGDGTLTGFFARKS